MKIKYRISFLIAILTISLFGQKKSIESKKDNIDDLCITLEFINNRDQEKRQLIKTPFFNILDSIYKSEGISLNDENSKLKSIKFLIQTGELTKEKMLENGRKANLILKTKKQQPKKEIDSLMILQIVLDNKNTEQLIDIIENYGGYPNKDNCSCEEETLKSLIVFRHSQTQYFDKIRFLIEQEHDAKRLPDGKYKIFLDHINGRTGKGL